MAVFSLAKYPRRQILETRRTTRPLKILTFVGIFVLILIFFVPIGGDNRAVAGPQGNELEAYYWSVGTMLILGPLTGGALDYLSPVSVLVGGVLIVIAYFGVNYLLSLKRSSSA